MTGDNEIPLGDPTAGPQYMTVWMKHRKGDKPEVRYTDGLLEVTENLFRLDPSSQIICLYNNQSCPPIKSSEDLPEDSRVLVMYFHVQNQAALYLQTGRDQTTGKKKKQPNIFATFLLVSKYDAEWISTRCNVGLATQEMSMRYKAVQEMDTRSDLCLVSCHYTLCAVGLKSALVPLLKKTEASMILVGRNKRFNDTPQPDFRLSARNIPDPQGGKEEDYTTVKQGNAFLKNAWHIEMHPNAINRMFPVWEEMYNSGRLQRKIGSVTSILRTGNKMPKEEVGRKTYLRAIKSNFINNCLYACKHLMGILLCNSPFKTKHVDSSKDARGETKTIQQVLLEMKVPGTPERITFVRAFDQCVDCIAGDNAGSATLIHHNDSKGVIVCEVARTVDGAITTLAKKIEYAPTDFLHHYMLDVLGYTPGTVGRALENCSAASRAGIGVLTWNSETWEVTTPLANQGITTYLDECDARLAELGISEGDIDLSQLLADKKKVDVENDEMEELIKKHRLYVDKDGKQCDPMVGASRASAATGASGISTTAGSEKSCASVNIKASYVNLKTSSAKNKGKLAAMDAYLKKMGLDPADAFKNFDRSLSSSHSSKFASESDSSTSEASSSTSDDDDETESKSDRSASGSSSSEVGQGGAHRRK